MLCWKIKYDDDDDDGNHRTQTEPNPSNEGSFPSLIIGPLLGHSFLLAKCDIISNGVVGTGALIEGRLSFLHKFAVLLQYVMFVRTDTK